MTQLSRSALESEISSLLADNTSGNITPANVRQTSTDSADSCFNLLTDTFAAIASGAISCSTIATTGSITLGNGLALQPDTTNAHTATLSAYYTTGTAYEAQATLTNGTTPTLAIKASTHGAVTIDGAVIGGVTPAAATVTTLTANSTSTLTGLATATAGVLIGNGGVIQTDSTTGHTALIQGYNTASSAYVTLGTITNGASATLALNAPTHGILTIDNATIGDTTACPKVNATLLTEPNTVVSVTSNAGTVPVTSGLNTFTNSSAATMTITLATASATDGQVTMVRIYDFSGVAETISWVNTENSTVTAPTTSNGSTTLPLTVTFMYNSATSKWRCINKA